VTQLRWGLDGWLLELGGCLGLVGVCSTYVALNLINSYKGLRLFVWMVEDGAPVVQEIRKRNVAFKLRIGDILKLDFSQ